VLRRNVFDEKEAFPNGKALNLRAFTDTGAFRGPKYEWFGPKTKFFIEKSTGLY
jgi:hypothetical protein